MLLHKIHFFVERDVPVNIEPVSEDPILEELMLEDPVLENPILDESIIDLLGEEGEEKENTTILHSEIKKRWQSILKDGLGKQTKEILMKKYEIPKNCTELTPPQLNDIIKAVLNDAGLNSDKRIVEKQKKLGLAISALGLALSKLVEQNSQENKETIETLSDSCRLLCDIFHSDSVTRRSLIIPGLNKDMKELITNADITEYLFGNDLQEKVKACKATKSSAKDLKIMSAVKPSVLKNKGLATLNSRGPLRPVQVQPRVSGPAYRAAAQPRPAPRRQQPKNSNYRQQQHSYPHQRRR